MIASLIQTLHEGGHSLVLATSKGSVHAYNGRGVSDLYRLLKTSPETLLDALLADKVVGKGAAALMLLGGVREVYADLISQAALNLFASCAVKVSYATLVPTIINRAGTGPCPVEARCADCPTPEECLVAIEAFFQQM